MYDLFFLTGTLYKYGNKADTLPYLYETMLYMMYQAKDNDKKQLEYNIEYDYCRFS